MAARRKSKGRGTSRKASPPPRAAAKRAARKPAARAAAASAPAAATATPLQLAERESAEVRYLLGRRVEDVATAFVSMAGELWIVKDRLAVLERVLERHGIPAPSSVDRYEPEPQFKERLDAERRAWVRRIVGALFPLGLPKAD
jgi:hypothetical protein